MMEWVKIAFLAIGTVAALIATIAFARIVWQGQAGHAVDFLTKINAALESEIAAKIALIAQLEAKVVTLEQSRDVSVVLKPLLQEMRDHDKRSNEFHRQTMIILNMIAESLGEEASEDAGQ